MGARLKRGGLAARTVTLKLRWSDFTTRTRQITVAQPVDDGEEDRAHRIGFADGAAVEGGGGAGWSTVGGSGLVAAVRQMSIFDLPTDKEAFAEGPRN